MQALKLALVTVILLLVKNGFAEHSPAPNDYIQSKPTQTGGEYA